MFKICFQYKNQFFFIGMDNCTLDCIDYMSGYNYTQACTTAQDICVQDTVQFIQAYYCIGNQSFFLLVGLGIFLLVFLYMAMDRVNSETLTPCVEDFIDKFRISPTFAGVTFLAFANGAPDVVTAIIAGSSSSDSTALIPFGSLFGALLFSSAIILSTVIYKLPGGTLQVKKRQILKPLIFYMVGIVYIILVSVFYRKMNVYLSVVLIVLYIIYIGLVLWNQRKMRKQRNKIDSLVTHENNDSDSEVQNVGKYISTISDEPNAQAAEPNSPVNQHNMIEVEEGKQSEKDSSQESEEKKKFFLIKGIQIVQAFILKYALPPITPKQWTPQKAIISFIITPFVIAISQGLTPIFQCNIQGIPWIIILSIPSILFLIHTVYIMITKRKPQNMVIYSLFTFIISICWITLVCSVLINVLQMFQILTNINSVFIGLTLLAYANCIGDYLTITKFASKGVGSTAIAGIFSGQLFNFFIGFSAVLIIQSLDGQYQFNLFNFSGSTYDVLSDSIVMWILICTLIYLGLILFMTIRKNGKFSKKQALIARISYLIFLGGAITLTITSDLFRDFTCDL